MLSAAAIRRPWPTLRPPPVPAWPRRMVSTRVVPPCTSEKRSQRWYGMASTVISWPTPVGSPSPQAKLGLWHVPQDSTLAAESRVSK